MEISDDFSMRAAVRELEALERLYEHLHRAEIAARHPDLTLVEVPEIGIEDAMINVLSEISEREMALSVYREADVQEVAHRESLRGPQ